MESIGYEAMRSRPVKSLVLHKGTPGMQSKAVRKKHAGIPADRPGIELSARLFLKHEHVIHAVLDIEALDQFLPFDLRL